MGSYCVEHLHVGLLYLSGSVIDALSDVSW